MSTTQWIAVFGIMASAAVAIVVAHLQRKQMRQIELYKQDPTVGLIPPPSALARFVKSHWDWVLAFGGPLLNLYLELTSSAPLTRSSVLIISVSVALLLTNLLFMVVFRVMSRVAAAVDALREQGIRHYEITSRTVDILKHVTGHAGDKDEP